MGFKEVGWEFREFGMGVQRSWVEFKEVERGSSKLGGCSRNLRNLSGRRRYLGEV